MTPAQTVTVGGRHRDPPIYCHPMRIHFYAQGSMIALYEHPRPRPDPGDYLGEADLTAEELEELHRMVDEVRNDL
jgi:hypothetical protein